MRQLLAAILFLCIMDASAQNADVPIYRSTEVDAKPNLKDGMYTLSKFIGENFVFPDSIANKQVKIFTSFIIEPDGSMTDIKSFYISVKDLNPGDMVSIMTEEQRAAESAKYAKMQAEAGRVLNLFKERWLPAKVAGNPVRCLYNYPISFNLE